MTQVSAQDMRINNNDVSVKNKDNVGSDDAVRAPATTSQEYNPKISDRSDKNSEPEFETTKKEKGVNCGKIDQFSAHRQTSKDSGGDKMAQVSAQDTRINNDEVTLTNTVPLQEATDSNAAQS